MGRQSEADSPCEYTERKTGIPKKTPTFYVMSDDRFKFKTSTMGDVEMAAAPALSLYEQGVHCQGQGEARALELHESAA